MTALTPLSRFDDLFSEFRRLLPSLAQGAEIMGMGDIRLDVEEKDKSYAVCAELPDVKKEDIRVEVDGNRVGIHAEIRRHTEEKDPKDKARVLMRETYRGSISRSFTLPSEIDEAGAARRK
ncbi:Hsp20/alpha crystallin family protein [Azohydromonas lata]|uniref:Hsp20 family protein n=1 Tax=Azohydromonas lata TaxID=45677 RepID=A0ABU5ICD5_9BURK|nr:Hsp20 family protein [Azohydromonas lata]MDZ5456775.1 Hsp20 family protein [Azohydromonas lata]